MAKLKFAEKKTQNNILFDKAWKILICDDEKDVHTITKSVLSDFIFKNRKVEFLSAYSGLEAISILEKNNDIAVILLDVVMESDTAGLDLVKTIRDDLKNNLIRIVLRTGQPGYAPEKDVILKYDINDYKEKTELTDIKLYTTVISALRSYKDLRALECNRNGLEKVIEATRNIFDKRSLELFADGVLTQLISILKLNGHSFLVSEDGFSLEKSDGNYNLLASTGKFINKDLDEILTDDIKELFLKAIINKKSIFLDDIFVGYFETDIDKANLIYITGCEELGNLDKNLINLFSNNVSIAFNNLYLNKEIIDTQKELIESLGETVEKRSKEASNHVRRVANISYALAKLYGFDEREASLLQRVSPMHDVGKIGIPDSILLKEDSLSKEEFEVMKQHTTIGYNILGHSQREVLKAAAIVAYEHHEKWDGSGYPNGKKGEGIHIYGRITAVADVFDSLLNKRCYKEPWDMEDILIFYKEQRGKHFEPKLVDLFLENIELFKDLESI